jgi:hypothetical protein
MKALLDTITPGEMKTILFMAGCFCGFFIGCAMTWLAMKEGARASNAAKP